jgi:hypothetical protein
MKLKYHPNGSTISMIFNVFHFGRFNPHSWSENPMFSKLSATHVVGISQSTAEALANMDSHSPKHVERWS